ncbi:uncharacterized protein ACLA_039810 [Aspergillus clavatus NRRL 1]|uniref:Gfd2/YDR514C-like C-terminal domain-containing protein n=1 Tax=Aspergillus clavatus (strain ATCC 1007 / CBS 513.65 / DSM 816 / NCTC 3887 / NRRL 1 / QM 1276 / 107) TaxID=344612 RepID=A1CKU1_ASPCL|nr:uncharacterized protein ACLA_039810 [Aspergillus clavatus NRRL 1]EAW09765.1 conserved hypothetical protein [Aspergillus clavatus NRRL 1]
MDRQDRLKLLFEDDESLLEINTGLHGVSITGIQLEDKTPLAVVTNIEVQPRKKEPAVEPEPSPRSEHTTQHDVEESTHTGEYKDSDSIQEGTAPADEVPVDESPVDGWFCPLMAIARYPYKAIKGELSQKVARGFFDKGQFWSRCWDVYYIHIPPQLGSRPLLLVPATQVREFLQEINCKLESKFTIPKESGMGMLLDLNGEIPHPAFLGRCASREDKDKLEATIPMGDYCPPSNDMVLAYEEMIENAVEASKNKSRSRSKQSKAKKQQSRMQIERGLADTRRRISCYLGLRSYRALDLPEPITDRSWEEKQDEQEKHAQKILDSVDIAGIPRPWDTTQPALHPFWKEPIFISIDVECNERCHEQVTEVGISTLDTLDLAGVSPGANAVNWTSRIRSRHMRVREYGHVVNHQFVSGCPGNFEFGESEWVRMEALAKTVQACFQPPYSWGSGDIDGVRLGDPPEYKRQQRSLVLVGHNTSMDVRYLQNLGIQVFENIATGFLESIDTAELHRHMRGESSQRSLGGMLQELGIIGWYLHNGGNDARYTLEALVRMVVRDAGHDEDLGRSG